MDSRQRGISLSHLSKRRHVFMSFDNITKECMRAPPLTHTHACIEISMDRTKSLRCWLAGERIS